MSLTPPTSNACLVPLSAAGRKREIEYALASKYDKELKISARELVEHITRGMEDQDGAAEGWIRMRAG